MRLFSPILLLGSAFGSECDVCVGMMKKFDAAVKEAGVTDLDAIEKEVRKICKTTKDQENRFCYYTGLTADAATTMHKVNLTPLFLFVYIYILYLLDSYSVISGRY